MIERVNFKNVLDFEPVIKLLSHQLFQDIKMVDEMFNNDGDRLFDDDSDLSDEDLDWLSESDFEDEDF